MGHIASMANAATLRWTITSDSSPRQDFEQGLDLSRRHEKQPIRSSRTPEDQVTDIRWSGPGAARATAIDELINLSIWGGAFAGIGLLAVGVLDSQPDVIPAGLCALVVAVVGLTQHLRARPAPLLILTLAAVNAFLLTITANRAAHAAVLPALTLMALEGVFVLPPRRARLYMAGCGLIGILSLSRILPEIDSAELMIGGIMFTVIVAAGSRFISLGGRILARGEETHRSLFDRSPVALLEEDFTAVGERLAALRRRGVSDLREYLSGHPDEFRELIATIRVRRANRSALTMIGAESVEDLARSFDEVTREDHELESYLVQFLAIWEGRQETAVDLEGVTLDGEPLEAVLHWSAPIDGDELVLSRVIVAISDITPRKIVEQRLANALDENRRLLDFEHALALCSHSLLMGRGDAALDQALTTLREAMDADRSYLTVNVDDPELGPSFHVVRSVSRPEYAVDDWMGQVMPWSKYQMVRDELAAGRSFQHIGTDEPGAGWSRSVLTVPVLIEGRWAGTVGFMDMRRRRPWSEEAVRMLEVAAPMLGTFWERESTRQRLEELVMSKDRFVASVSHELRTPLSAVLGFAQELKDNAYSYRAEELTDMLELIADQSQEMADMVEDLLVSARADIGMVTIHPQNVYLRSQAETVLAGLGPAGGKQIDVAGGRGKVWADPSRTRQIIRNLLTNAVRYGGDHVVVEAVEHDEETTLTVTDDGVGVDPTQWEEIFEPYQRAHDAPTQPASIGLGLTVSRQLARLMGGELTYRSGEDGSVFTLTLPSGQDAGDEAETVTASARFN